MSAMISDLSEDGSGLRGLQSGRRTAACLLWCVGRAMRVFPECPSCKPRFLRTALPASLDSTLQSFLPSLDSFSPASFWEDGTNAFSYLARRRRTLSAWHWRF